MSAVVSKNPYDLLGDDGSEAPPSKGAPAVETQKPTRTTAGASRASERGGRSAGGAGRRGDDSRRGGNDARGGRTANDNFRAEHFKERGGKGGRERGNGRGRGGRDDRHSKTGVVDTEKQVAAGWGAQTGNGEWTDEQAADQIANADTKAAAREDAGANDEAEAEPEEKVVSYADYLAQQADSRAKLSAPEARKANEGVKADKKWATAELKREDEEEEFFPGEQKRSKERKERKEKQVIEIDQRYVEPSRGDRGGRGGRGRGDRERGDRGDRGGRGRGDRSDRGEGRGASRGAPRGAPRGGRGGSSIVNPSDESAFPSLGS